LLPTVSEIPSMRRILFKLLIVFLVLGGIGGAAAVGYGPALKYWKDRNRPEWETGKIVRGDAVREISSTGTIKPVLSVSVGSFVSGPIVELNVDFNDEVKKGQILAKVDPRLFAAALSRDEASLATREAEVERVRAQLQQARNNRQRGEKLRSKNADFISDREMDALRFDCDGLEAQLKVAEASILQARAALETSRANLEYTEIRSPVDGVVIDRKIDPGQTLAAQFQTPELFVVAPDLRQKVHVFASVVEADIGLIQKAAGEGRPVTFTVDAHPEDLFTGVIEQVRFSATDVQNVVLYPVIVAAANTDPPKLLPGMTATISFEVDSQKDVLKIPNTALRFYPPSEALVREQDRQLLDGSAWRSTDETEDEQALTAKEKTQAQQNKNKRHVWVNDGEFLRAVEIVTGLVENKFTVLVSGDLDEGDELVTALKKK
jgi:HlyD family secretion protein